MGPGSSVTYTPHCLRRDFSATLAVQTLAQSVLDFELEADSFWEYDRRVEVLNLTIAGVTTHGGGHFSVGGQVGEVCSTLSLSLYHPSNFLSRLYGMRFFLLFSRSFSLLLANRKRSCPTCGPRRATRCSTSTTASWISSGTSGRH
jgi:hypothetical protein